MKTNIYILLVEQNFSSWKTNGLLFTFIDHRVFSSYFSLDSGRRRLMVFHLISLSITSLLIIFCSMKTIGLLVKLLVLKINVEIANKVQSIT